MPRKPLIRCSQFPYHVTNRSNNRDFFYIEKTELWTIFINIFKELEDQFNCKIHAFILMSNHYHLLISTPDSNLGEAMKYLHREVARAANKVAGRINHFFGGRYKWSVIYEEAYYWNSIKYIFRNPVRAGICKDVSEYQFSSLNTSYEDFKWEMTDFFNKPNELIDLDLDWLNEPFQTEKEEAIKKALRRREFKLPRGSGLRTQALDLVWYKKGTVTCSK